MAKDDNHNDAPLIWEVTLDDDAGPLTFMSQGQPTGEVKLAPGASGRGQFGGTYTYSYNGHLQRFTAKKSSNPEAVAREYIAGRVARWHIQYLCQDVPSALAAYTTLIHSSLDDGDHKKYPYLCSLWAPGHNVPLHQVGGAKKRLGAAGTLRLALTKNVCLFLLHSGLYDAAVLLYLIRAHMRDLDTHFGNHLLVLNIPNHLAQNDALLAAHDKITAIIHAQIEIGFRQADMVPLLEAIQQFHACGGQTQLVGIDFGAAFKNYAEAQPSMFDGINLFINLGQAVDAEPTNHSAEISAAQKEFFLSYPFVRIAQRFLKNLEDNADKYLQVLTESVDEISRVYGRNNEKDAKTVLLKLYQDIGEEIDLTGDDYVEKIKHAVVTALFKGHQQKCEEIARAQFEATQHLVERRIETPLFDEKHALIAKRTQLQEHYDSIKRVPSPAKRRRAQTRSYRSAVKNQSGYMPILMDDLNNHPDQHEQAEILQCLDDNTYAIIMRGSQFDTQVLHWLDDAPSTGRQLLAWAQDMLDNQDFPEAVKDKGHDILVQMYEALRPAHQTDDQVNIQKACLDTLTNLASDCNLAKEIAKRLQMHCFIAEHAHWDLVQQFQQHAPPPTTQEAYTERQSALQLFETAYHQFLTTLYYIQYNTHAQDSKSIENQLKEAQGIYQQMISGIFDSVGLAYDAIVPETAITVNALYEAFLSALRRYVSLKVIKDAPPHSLPNDTYAALMELKNIHLLRANESALFGNLDKNLAENRKRDLRITRTRARDYLETALINGLGFFFYRLSHNSPQSPQFNDFIDQEKERASAVLHAAIHTRNANKRLRQHTTPRWQRWLIKFGSILLAIADVTFAVLAFLGHDYLHVSTHTLSAPHIGIIACGILALLCLAKMAYSHYKTGIPTLISFQSITTSTLRTTPVKKTLARAYQNGLGAWQALADDDSDNLLDVEPTWRLARPRRHSIIS